MLEACRTLCQWSVVCGLWSVWREFVGRSKEMGMVGERSRCALRDAGL